jgi:dTDP-4-amino-4,6-dideoxygalactose transaminase
MTDEVLDRVPILDLRPDIDRQWDELTEAINEVLRSGRFILGPNVSAFEEEMAAYLGVDHAIGVNSGTDAVTIGLRALGVRPGDEVITTPFTFFATPESISSVGATPVFVDIDPDTFNLDVAAVAAAIGERTKAIVPVHLFGLACDMEAIERIATEHDLLVVEDVAQAMGGEYRGARLGSLGDVGAFSFFPSKNLGGFGDGGLIATDDGRVAELARALRAHGGKATYANEMLGYNSRLDELQAAVLRVRLRHLDDANRRRRAAAARYSELLRDVPGVRIPIEPPGARHVYHQYTVRVPPEERDGLRARLAAGGIDTMVYYPTPCHRLPVYAASSPTLPAAEEAARSVLSLPMGPSIDDETIDRVVRGLR